MRSRMHTRAALVAVATVLPVANAQTLLHEFDKPWASAANQAPGPIANVGDVDGDGKADLAAGVPGENPGSGWATGKLLLVSGATGGLLWQVVGPTSFAMMGQAVAGGGDLNGDGRGDVLTSFYDATVGKDGVRAYSGATGALIRTFPAPAGSVEYAKRIAGGSDIDLDGVPDVAVTGRAAASGAAWVFSGATGALLLDLTSSSLGFPESNSAVVVTWLSDLTGDGIDELALGSATAPSPTIGSGRIRVHDGATGAIVAELGPAQSGAWAYGAVLARVGDVDADGKEDLATKYMWGLCGGSLAKVDLISVATRVVLHTWTGFAPGCSLTSGDYFGSALAGVPDVDGDLVPEVLVGAQQTSFMSPHIGGSFLYSGRTRKLISFVPPPQTVAGSIAGAHVAGMDDLDGDGRGDFAVSCPGYFQFPVTYGRVQFFSGAPDAITSIGVGCPGSGGPVPTLSAAMLGPSSLQIDVQGGPAGVAALLLLGYFPDWKQVPPTGCKILVQPLLFTLPFALSGTGTATILGALPPGFQGTFSAQAVMNNPAVIPGNIAFSNGLQFSIH